MVTDTPSHGKRPLSGQIVRAPSASDGVGRALRNAYGEEMRLPGMWDQYLKRLDNWSGK